MLLSSFNSESEEVRNAAAFALGSVTLGNMQLLLPRLLQLIQTEKFSYLLLSALKEIIAHFSTSSAALDVVLSVPRLRVSHPVSARGVERRVDARDGELNASAASPSSRPLRCCLASCSSPASPSPQVRAVCITALRFTFTPLMDSALLQQHLQLLPRAGERQLSWR